MTSILLSDSLYVFLESIYQVLYKREVEALKSLFEEKHSQDIKQETLRSFRIENQQIKDEFKLNLASEVHKQVSMITDMPVSLRKDSCGKSVLLI